MIRLALFVLAVLVLAPSGMAAQSASSPGEEVTLRPGDMIEVTIWREEDLSGVFPVDENGIVTLPLLGDRHVTDIPISRLRQLLVEEYRVQLNNPTIRVTPLRQVLVLGAVRKPGAYEVSPTTSVIALIADAEGVAPGGNIRRIRIIRGSDVIEERVEPGSTLADLGVQSGDQVWVGQHSWVTRNRGLLVSVLLALPSVIYTITRIAG